MSNQPRLYSLENLNEIYHSDYDFVDQIVQIFVENIRSLSNILLLQSDKFSELQVNKFSRNTLKSLRKNLCDIHTMKVKVMSTVKSKLQEYVEVLY